MRRTAPAVAALALALLTACGSDDAPPAAGGSTTPAATTTATATATAKPAGDTGPSLPPGCTSPAPAPAGATVVTATVSGGTVTPPSRRYDIRLGTPIRLVVTTDAADEVHVHGYDLRAKTTPGCPAVVDLRADIPGSVEVELESSHLELFELRSS